MKPKISQTISALLPDEVSQEMRDNLKALVRSQLESMDLLTREQFEIQAKILQRTRARVGELEQQVAELETRLREAGKGDAAQR